ncbi:hypothetical protein GQ457_09G010110 [Hibiscus cannabinus]
MNPTNSMYQGYHHAATAIFGLSNGFELRDGGFESSPQLEEEDSNVLPVYETSGMLSEMFDVPSGIAAVAAAANSSTELLERALPSNYQGHMPAGESKSDFNHQQLPSINAGSAAAMQLPQPRSPSSSTSLQGVLESQGLSLSLSSSFPHLEVKDGEFLYCNQPHVGLGSSTGMVTVLRNSKYVKDAQELLEEFCSVGRGQLKKNKFGRNKTNHCSNPGGSSLLTKDVPHLSSADRIEHQRRKVERRYKLYCEQMKMLVNSLDQVIGIGAAVPYTALAQKAMSRHFRYPSDADKQRLARQTGLSRNQVSNWFINARVRLWKPMVEEMYQQETKEEDGERDPNNSSNNAQTSTTTAATPAGKTCEINAMENDTSSVGINRQCLSFSGKKRKQCSSLTATEVAASGGDSLTLGLRHAGNMPDNLQCIFSRNFHFSYQV